MPKATPWPRHRSSLNGIIGMLSVNEAHAEDAEYVSQDRKKARVAADHLFSLINDVLDMSKIEDGKVVLEHKPFSIIDAIDEVLVIGRSVKADAGSVPIFAMTANAFAEDAQRAHDAGMNGHLTKPIDMEKVKQALATARR